MSFKKSNYFQIYHCQRTLLQNTCKSLITSTSNLKITLFLAFSILIDKSTDVAQLSLFENLWNFYHRKTKQKYISLVISLDKINKVETDGYFDQTELWKWKWFVQIRIKIVGYKITISTVRITNTLKSVILPSSQNEPCHW